MINSPTLCPSGTLYYYKNINLVLALVGSIPSSRMLFLQLQSYLDVFLFFFFFSEHVPITATITVFSLFFLVYLTYLTELFGAGIMIY